MFILSQPAPQDTSSVSNSLPMESRANSDVHSVKRTFSRLASPDARSALSGKDLIQRIPTRKISSITHASIRKSSIMKKRKRQSKACKIRLQVILLSMMESQKTCLMN